jgi:hypothetical protein
MKPVPAGRLPAPTFNCRYRICRNVLERCKGPKRSFEGCNAFHVNVGSAEPAAAGHTFALTEAVEEWRATADASSRSSSSGAQHATGRCVSQPAFPQTYALERCMLSRGGELGRCNIHAPWHSTLFNMTATLYILLARITQSSLIK